MSKKLRQQVTRQLKELNLCRLESLGQNFLVDQEIITRVCQVVAMDYPETVLEIGPGLGALTFPLALAVKRLVAVELDRGLAQNLAKSAPTNVEVAKGDITRQDLSNFGLVEREYIVFGSLPFNMGTAIIRWLLENERPPKVIYVILQQEVIDRILAKNKRESLLSLAVNFYGKATSLFAIPRGAYQPQPRVDTGFLKIDCSRRQPHQRLKEPFFALIKAGFASKRKYLSSNLAKNLHLARPEVEKALTECRLSTKIRAEALSFDDWLFLAQKLSGQLPVDPVPPVGGEERRSVEKPS